ncbi:MAG: hypothetical protein Ct9H90mP16_14050 [Candidatus Poseidoniales archaeon]|nr:MAG: hypothetical protein Ct9H90mP16_14050 [Candidatus Poseidoniales archaeon]
MTKILGSNSILLTHTHRDHTPGVKAIRDLSQMLRFGVMRNPSPRAFLERESFFRKTRFYHVWNHAPNVIETWRCGSIEFSRLSFTWPCPWPCDLPRSWVYVAGDLLFTMRSGRVDLPGPDPAAQWGKSCLCKINLANSPP